MSESGRRPSATRRFVVDTNVFVSAIKPFSKGGRGASTRSLALLIKLITDARMQLFGNSWLVDEYRRLAEELNSETSALILEQLIAKTNAAVEVGRESIARCRRYLPDEEAADAMHAATCLVSGAVLITNDGDFDRIRGSGVIEVWGISEAIRKLSIQEWRVVGCRPSRAVNDAP